MNNLKKLRLKCNLTINELSNISSISVKNLSVLESDSSHKIPNKYVSVLCSVLNCNSIELLGDEFFATNIDNDFQRIILMKELINKMDDKNIGKVINYVLDNKYKFLTNKKYFSFDAFYNIKLNDDVPKDVYDSYLKYVNDISNQKRKNKVSDDYLINNYELMRLRVNKGYSQTYVAKETKLNVSTIFRSENNIGINPSKRTLLKLAKFYEMNFDEFIELIRIR